MKIRLGGDGATTEPVAPTDKAADPPSGDMRHFSNSSLIGVGPARAALATRHLHPWDLWASAWSSAPRVGSPSPADVRLRPRAGGGSST